MSGTTTSSNQRVKGEVDFDVVVVGGALAGASTALLLKRQQPDLRILVVERSERFGHKVGEATVEVSGYFLEQVLRLGDHLYRRHLPKHGLRYWFASKPTDTFASMGEVGPQSPPHVASFQLDRSVLDQHVLDLAEQAGCEVLRPARVGTFEESWPVHRVRLTQTDSATDRESESGAEQVRERSVTCRWLVDASGRHGFIARKKRLLQRLEEHPTSATWGRWNGVLNIDGPEFEAGEGSTLPRLRAQRRLATNHFTGKGWWSWVIPLSNGKTSVGLVYNRKLVDPNDGVGPLGVEVPLQSESQSKSAASYERFVRAQPGLRELLADAKLDGDCMSFAYLPYRSSQYMDAGWALVGDAASFIDPYYSPGLDHLAMSVVATVRILGRDLADQLDKPDLIEAIAAHNKAFTVSYRRWFEGLYLDKYEILGDSDLVTASFLVETSLYYFGVVTPILRQPDALANPVFGAPLPQSRIAFRLARAFRGRMVYLARRREELGLYGRNNSSWRYYPGGFGLGWRVWPTLTKGLRVWLRCEAATLWRGLVGPRGGVEDEGRADKGDQVVGEGVS